MFSAKVNPGIIRVKTSNNAKNLFILFKITSSPDLLFLMLEIDISTYPRASLRIG
jgi:hypothetical protein